MFVKIMLKNEEDWYARENLEVPKIHFLDNSPILGKRFEFSLSTIILMCVLLIFRHL